MHCASGVVARRVRPWSASTSPLRRTRSSRRALPASMRSADGSLAAPHRDLGHAAPSLRPKPALPQAGRRRDGPSTSRLDHEHGGGGTGIHHPQWTNPLGVRWQPAVRCTSPRRRASARVTIHRGDRHPTFRGVEWPSGHAVVELGRDRVSRHLSDEDNHHENVEECGRRDAQAASIHGAPRAGVVQHGLRHSRSFPESPDVRRHLASPRRETRPKIAGSEMRRAAELRRAIVHRALLPGAAGCEPGRSKPGPMTTSGPLPRRSSAGSSRTIAGAAGAGRAQRDPGPAGAGVA